MAAALPVPLLTQEGPLLPSSKCIITALRLVVRLDVSLFPLFTPQCQHTLHHARNISLSRCLLSWFCLTSDGGTRACDTAQVDHKVGSLATQESLGSQLCIVFDCHNLVQVQRRQPSLGHSHWRRTRQRHQVPRPNRSRHSVPLSPLLRRASLVMSTHRLRSCALLYLLKPPPRLPHTPRNNSRRLHATLDLGVHAVVFYQTPLSAHGPTSVA